MTAVISFLAVLSISLLIVRIAGVALTVTGMPREAARFEARSAWSGTGFTTSQSERIIRHPVRRKIVTFLILLRNAGLIGAASTLFLSVANIQDSQENAVKVALLIGGVLMLWFIAGNWWVDKVLSNCIAWLLHKFTDLGTHNRAVLLHLGGSFTIQELSVESTSWLCGKSISKLDLKEEGILLLGIDRKSKDFLGVPAEHIEIKKGDNLMLYGRSKALEDLARRKSDPEGESAREDAKKERKEDEAKQEKEVKKNS